MKTNKSKKLLPILTLTGIVALTLLQACKPKEVPAPNEPPAKPATPAAAAATPAPTATPAAQPAAAAEAAKPAPTESAAPAAGTVRYEAQPGSKMKIEGTSTIHDWSMESMLIGGYIEADAAFPEGALTDAKVAHPTVLATMPVRSFKSNNKRMDEIMQEHMKEPQHKKIEYKLIELKPKSAAGATGPLQFDATGALTVAGKTQTNTMPVTIEKKDGKLKVTGSTALKMTDFDVKPPAPSIGLGLIKTGDEIKLTFEWALAPKS